MKKFIVECTTGEGKPATVVNVGEMALTDMVKLHYRKELCINRISTAEGETLYDCNSPEKTQIWA